MVVQIEGEKNCFPMDFGQFWYLNVFYVAKHHFVRLVPTMLFFITNKGGGRKLVQVFFEVI